MCFILIQFVRDIFYV